VSRWPFGGSLCCCASRWPPPAEAAPAPFRQRETAAQARGRLLRECLRRLDDLEVKWLLRCGERGQVVQFSVTQPHSDHTLSGSVEVAGGDVYEALQAVVRRAEAFLPATRK
jgi:hypothetical protein